MIAQAEHLDRCRPRLYADALTDDEVRKLYVGTHHDLENDAEASAMAPANAFDAPRDHLLAHHSFDHQTVTQYEYGDWNATDQTFSATQQARKTVHIGHTAVAENTKTDTTYLYDAAGRMAVVNTTTFDADGTTIKTKTRVVYEYNDSGIRSRSIEETLGGTNFDVVTSRKITTCLTDSNTPGGGYQQVLEQREYDDAITTAANDGITGLDAPGQSGNPGTYTGFDRVIDPAELSKLVRNLLAHDILAQIAQAYNAGVIESSAQRLTFLNDAGESTRALVDPLGIAVETYRYTAYGMAVGFAMATASTWPAPFNLIQLL